jgi:hypothetical protein
MSRRGVRNRSELRRVRRRSGRVCAVTAAALTLSWAATQGPADAAPSARTPGGRPGIDTETEFRHAWADPRRTRIDLTGDIVLRDCRTGDPIRESSYPMRLVGHGHAIRQACFEKRLLRQDGTGYLRIEGVHLSRGGSDGPGAAVTTRGEITIADSTVTQNLAEEPGGGVFSMRRATVIRSKISGNLANDDGGGVYARRGGVAVYDSVLSNNLVDGSGGAIGSTGDILVVRSRVDGNTTDGDGGALYADEAGDVTVIDSTIDGSTADGPGGAIFTLDGDVAVIGSALLGNRADDRGGAISGEADVLIVGSTVARNLAVAHVGGGVWARGSLAVVNSTVTDNYAEGQGGGLLAAGGLWLVGSTVSQNIAPIGANLGVGGTFHSFGSIVGPAYVLSPNGDTRPTRLSCRVYEVESGGHNLTTDPSCDLTADTDVMDVDGPGLGPLEDDPDGRVMWPLPGSAALDRIPTGQCLGDLPVPTPAAQLVLDVDLARLLALDQLGSVRDDGVGCGIGATRGMAP